VSAPEKIGPYRVVKRLAVGGMAELFLALRSSHEGFKRLVVVKRIRPERASNEQLVTMFLDEARLGASVHHPSLVQVLDLDQAEGVYYMVLEYVRGPSLKRLIESSGQLGLPMELALSVAIALCEGLHHLHTRRDALGRPMTTVHRDLNPDNVVVSYEGAVKLIDLGIAKSDEAVYETATGVIKGTYGYMAPEQLLSRKDVDHRADLFALGVLLYETTLGVHPFGLDTVDQLIEMVRSGQFAPPESLYEGYPEALSRLVCRCLEVEPNDRPPDARLVQLELERVCLSLGFVPSMARVAEQVRLLVPEPSVGSRQGEKAPKPRDNTDQRTAQIDFDELEASSHRPDDDEATWVFKHPKKL
jgi:serine/threonine protein kinase